MEIYVCLSYQKLFGEASVSDDSASLMAKLVPDSVPPSSEVDGEVES